MADGKGIHGACSTVSLPDVLRSWSSLQTLPSCVRNLLIFLFFDCFQLTVSHYTIVTVDALYWILSPTSFTFPPKCALTSPWKQAHLKLLTQCAEWSQFVVSGFFGYLTCIARVFMSSNISANDCRYAVAASYL